MIAQISNRSEEENKAEAAAAGAPYDTPKHHHGYTMLEDSLVLMTVQKLLYIDGKNNVKQI